VVTAFAIPRAFDGEAALRQRNALRSWRALGLEVLLLGDEVGVATEAAAVGATHEPTLARTELGTPLVSAAFERAAQLATTPFLLYANADVVFAGNPVTAARRIGLDRFVALGHRLDLDLDRELAFDAGWAEELALEARDRGRVDSPFAIDWFLFPRDLRFSMPPFAVGRPGWDNWLIAQARALGVPVVDAGAAVTAVHQRHGYAHVPAGRAGTWDGPEGDRNRELAGGAERLCILDATHVLTDRGLVRAVAGPYLRRRLFRFARRHPPLDRALLAVSRARRRAASR
jgi:hypothetical protein